MNESQVSLIYDHYKDTFFHIRDRERQRDRLFFFVIALLGFLVLQERYSLFLSQFVSEIEIVGIKINLNQVPLPAVLSTSWTFLSVLFLRYFQVTVHIDKQYEFLHSLENILSESLDYNKAFCRESSGYFTQKTEGFRNIVWFFYTVIFPLIIFITIIFSIYSEWNSLFIPCSHKIYDFTIGVITSIFLFFYTYGICLKRYITLYKRSREMKLFKYFWENKGIYSFFLIVFIAFIIALFNNFSFKYSAPLPFL